MHIKIKPKRGGPDNGRWLLTYSDLITLLMIFFIMMYVISNVNAQKFAKMANVLGQVFGNKSAGVLNNGTSILKDSGNTNPKASNGNDAQDISQLNQVKQELEGYLKSKSLNGKVSVTLEERGLVISLQDTILFDSGSAILTPEAGSIISDIGAKLQALSNFIRIEGHTDDLPIQTVKYPSNWELSSARATNVVRELIMHSQISSDRLSATGYGEYRPLETNDSEQHRQMNRRVDILILKETYKQVEPANSTMNGAAVGKTQQ